MRTDLTYAGRATLTRVVVDTVRALPGRERRAHEGGGARSGEGHVAGEDGVGRVVLSVAGLG